MTQQNSEQQDYLGLHNLVAPNGAYKKPKRLGRGESSGWGKTAGRGHKGQKSRKSGHVRLGFEGGQNPLACRLPKRGFRPLASQHLQCAINLRRIARYFDQAGVVDIKALVACGLLANTKQRVKVLAQGDVSCALQLHVHAISEAARKKLEAQGGSVHLVQQTTGSD
ncbi:MAG: 50S ribosomal protein L15 [Myxococcota bacterium]